MAAAYLYYYNAVITLEEQLKMLTQFYILMTRLSYKPVVALEDLLSPIFTKLSATLNKMPLNLCL